MPRKQIIDVIEELKSWLPNYDHGPKDYTTLLFRILASAPGGEELEDMGYETFNLGWHEIEQLGRVLETIQDKSDVEDIVAALTHEEEEEVEEARRRRLRPRRRHEVRIGTIIPSTWHPGATYPAASAPPPPPPPPPTASEARRRRLPPPRHRRRPR
jgi:hypothetical protein